ncbi:MAG: DUF2169 domain-containing protein [Gammaproteobacteria bacterium]
MEIYNCTDFQFAILNGRLDYPGYSATFIIKGLFRLNNGDVLRAEEEQPYAMGDQYYADDDHQVGGIRYASDFVYYKPQTDVSLVGHCYAPQGQKTASCLTQFMLAEKSMNLHVFGDRFWIRNASGYFSTKPIPFEKIELRYENSFGGAVIEGNPIGKGSARTVLANGSTVWPLPNIESPRQHITSPKQVPVPAGFGPLNSGWSLRKSKLGTYDKHWLEKKWPWFPDDFDPAYFNSSPQAMQISGYLSGDESLQFSNLHPEISDYHTTLPRIKIRCFTRTHSKDPSIGKSFQEINMELDTLAIDMDAEQATLVWRGWSRTDSEEMQDIQDILVVAENIEGDPMSVDEGYALLQKCKSELDERYTAEEPEDNVTEAGSENEDFDVDAILAQAEEDSRKLLIESGVDPDNLPEPTKEDIAQQAVLLAEMGLDDSEFLPLTREQVERNIIDGKSFFQKDLSDLDLNGIDFHGIDLREANLSNMILNNSNFSTANLSGAILNGSDFHKTSFKNACLQEADMTDADLSEVNFTGANMEDAVLESCKADSANFNNVQASGADFRNAKLRSGSFINANLPRASFESADLNHVNMESSRLQNITLNKATAIYGNFTKADMTGVRASDNCDFSGAIFKGCQMEGANFESARCIQTDFSYADMHDVNLISADLTDANFKCSDLRQSKLAKAHFDGTCMMQCNLYEASLEKAILKNTDFRLANLYGAELLGAEITHTNFSQANIKMTKLSTTK